MIDKPARIKIASVILQLCAQLIHTWPALTLRQFQIQFIEKLLIIAHL